MMIAIIKKGLFILGLMSCFTITAQTYNNVEEDAETVVVSNQILDAFSSLGIDNAHNPNLNIQGNAVFLQQIGQLNQANVFVRSSFSDINLVQDGDNNLIDLNYDVNQVFTQITQDGDFNIVRDIAIAPGEDVFLDLEQLGDNLQFERQGVNSITNSLQFKQTAASPRIIVRSITNANGFIPEN